MTPAATATVAMPPISAGAATPLLAVDGMSVEFDTSRGKLRAVDRVSWSVAPGEVHAIVGESGCGKSVTAHAIMGLLPKNQGRVVEGSIRFEGRELRGRTEREMANLRGGDIGMIFQEPMSSLNPVLTIGRQIMEPLFVHRGLDKGAARRRAMELLKLVGISDVERRLEQYPHQLSGGMRQRVMIAMALACEPRLLIADEPTTALDVTIQAQILGLMRDLCDRLGISIVLITHNLGIVARYADRITVMYAGRAVESGPAADVFANPSHPYTRGLIGSVPRLDMARTGRLETIEGQPPNLAEPMAGCRYAPRCPFALPICGQEPPQVAVAPDHLSACHRALELPAFGSRRADPELSARTASETVPLLEVRKVTKSFDSGAQKLTAVRDVSLTVARGEVVSIVGESGCGKTTLGRMALGLTPATEGSVSFDGANIARARGRDAKALRRRMQIVFQDPYSSLNPRMRVRDIIAEPLKVHGLASGASAIAARVDQLLKQVGLPAHFASRFPHQMSGGQRQRVGIARAIAYEPDFIVCDEPVSALDVSVQGQVVNLLSDLRRDLGIAYLFIAHDLAVVRHISDRVIVMYLGRIMEEGPADEVYERPLHPYTRALIEAVPVPDPAIERGRNVVPLKGELPSIMKPVPGCPFNTRCPLASEECRQVVPPLRELGPGHRVACIKVEG
jgi:peptide/nickel transport system ATP-binding protein